MITTELQFAVETKVLELYINAQKVFGKMFDLCKIEYKDMGTTAGKAHYYENRITLSPTLLKENSTNFINQIVGHEIAHLITFNLYGQFIKPHGKHWKSVMLNLNLNPARCHDYNVASVKHIRKPQKQFHYHCNCQTHILTNSMHHRAITGTIYSCNKCHIPIKLNPPAKPTS